MHEEPDALDESELAKGPVGTAKVTKAECVECTKRKLAAKVSTTVYDLSKGARFTTAPEVLTADLTPEMIADGSWKTTKFKKFNLDAAPAIPAGALHPLLKVSWDVVPQCFLLAAIVVLCFAFGGVLSIVVSCVLE